MAQIGSPSAGWYTDPSGQHRARYWDGDSWTEQVRDDLGEAAETAVAAPEAPPVQAPPVQAAPPGVPATSAQEPPSAHPMADTVAGVAEAVAAVAANDLAAPTPEPPLVVDYGTDPQWGAASGNGNGAVVDPFAPSAPTMEPVTEPTPMVPGPAPVADAPQPAPFAAETTAYPTTEPAPLPVAEPAPLDAGPAPGWYPDPAARHQARLWDGTRWTERVADNGVEGVDPLPGAPGAITTTVDPTVGAWSSELQTAATGAVATATGAEPATTGTDGAPMTAGQMSLASLPPTTDDPTTERSAPVRQSVKVRVGGGFVLGGAIALVVGSAMSWMQVTGPKVGDEASSTGIDIGDGRITLVLGLVLALLGAAIITGRMGRFGGTKVAAMGSLVAGAAALAVTAVDIADVADRASRLGVPAGAVSNVGTGLWVAFLGALFAVGGGLMAFANRQ